LGVLDEVWILSEGRIQNVYPLDQLRKDALRITGRLKVAQASPRQLRIFEEQRSGDVVAWLVVDKEALYEVRHRELLDQMQTEPLSLETAFKVLLSHTAEPS